MVTEGVTFPVTVNVSHSFTVAVHPFPSVIEVMQYVLAPVAGDTTVIFELAVVTPVIGQVIPAPVPLNDQLGVPVADTPITALSPVQMVPVPVVETVGSGFTVRVITLFCGFEQNGAVVYCTLVMLYVVVCVGLTPFNDCKSDQGFAGKFGAPAGSNGLADQVTLYDPAALASKINEVDCPLHIAAACWNTPVIRGLTVTVTGMFTLVTQAGNA
jgi:hypothetical protein